MSPRKTDECNEPSANPEQPVFRIPKCWEEHDPPPGYFDPVDRAATRRHWSLTTADFGTMRNPCGSRSPI